MSHLADALRRANRSPAAGDLFREDDHPWGEALDAAVPDAPERVWTLPNERPDDGAGAAPAAAGAPPRHGSVHARDGAFVAETPADGAADRGARQQIAGLVERVFLPVSGSAPRVVAFASIDPDDATGRIAADAALMLAQRTGSRVAAVDLNFGSPTLHACFAFANAPGLAEALGADAPLLSAARQAAAGLWVIPAGNGRAGAELSAGSRARLSHLTDAFDYVVMTLEPLADSFGAGLATLADGVVLVVNAETTRRDAGRMIAERLQSSGAALLGAVLTNRRYPIPDAIYRRL